ncbi:hypothetical protein NPIL_387781 [Nephila pilipes]|uniref:Uncharacterized protein n=1 Tax=Nephila pilipes TaxID=299642 RepID=A0A8X6JDR1_NEPPI|nr:hypothetical protein NPIL_387781 [Nephila pilipes]
MTRVYARVSCMRGAALQKDAGLEIWAVTRFISLEFRQNTPRGSLTQPLAYRPCRVAFSRILVNEQETIKGMASFREDHPATGLVR